MCLCGDFMTSDNFNWYWLHELGTILLDSDDEAYLRTAINRFYFSAFCEARDYLIQNKIYYNEKFRKILHSRSGNVHSATSLIFRIAHEFRLEEVGLGIDYSLTNLRKLRNIADYETPSKDFKNIAIESKSNSYFVFNTLRDL